MSPTVPKTAFATFLVATMLLASLAPLALARHGEMATEGGEPPRAAQKTCVLEATTGPTGECPLIAAPPRPSGLTYPTDGVRILDGFVASGAPWSHRPVLAHNPSEYSDPVENARVALSRTTQSTQPGAADRETGLVAPVILPGTNQVLAWFGIWKDIDQDNVIDVVVKENAANGFKDYLPGNEFASSNADLFAFIEPGAHPTRGQPSRPDETQPDVQYTSPGSDPHRLYRATDGVIFLTGSLLETLTIDSVSEPILLADPLASRPFTLTANSLVDIDDYVAVAPAPVDALYRAILAPYVRAVDSPGASSCPSNCVFPPLPIEEAAPLVEVAFSRYEHETDAGSGNSAAERLSQFQEAFHAWTDVIPTLAYPATSGGLARRPLSSPLPGLGENGGLAVPRGGYFLPEAWTGIWRDLDYDTFVGTAAKPDAYEGGNNPRPDDYYHPRGEFLADDGCSLACGTTFSISLVPDATWGAAGVAISSSGGTIVRATDADCPAPGHPSGFCIATGSTPVVFRERLVLETGHFSAKFLTFFPEGTSAGGFAVCFGDIRIKYQQGGLDLDEIVRDCDRVEKLKG